MVGMNPCYCWNLKDGCITVGIWTLICSIIQLAIFSWQSYVIKWERDKTANRRLPFYGTQSSYDFRYYGPDYSSFYVTPEERFFTGLFVIQILCLISAFFLLFGSVSLIYGIHTNSKHLVWPWFPCVVSSILCSVAYCITWWASGVDNYWLILTIIEWFSVMINLYALLCVIVQYRRILRNYDEYSEEQKVPVVVWDDQNQKGNFTETKLGPEAYWNKTFEEEPKPAVKSNVSAKGPSQFIGTQFGQKPMPYHAQITSALNDPGHVLERYTTEPGIKANDRYDARSFTTLNVATEEAAELPAKEDRSENDIIAQPVPIAKRHTEDEILRSRSVDALTAHLEDRDRRSVPHSKSKESITSRHRHRSHSHHRGDRREDYYSDEETDIARSVAGSRSRISETDTGYSCSDGSRRSRHRRRHHSHDESERGHHHRHRRHRRPRDVKRDDKERSHSNNNNNNNISNANNRQSSTNSSPAALQAGLIGMPLPTYSPYEMGAVRIDPNYGLSQLFPSYSLNPAFNQANLLQAVNPSYSPVGGMQVLPTGLPHNSSIGATNAHIAKPIPGQTGGQPQKFQINSEIFISYNNDPANQASRPSSRQQVIQLQPVVGAASLGSKQHSPGVDFNETMEPRNSSAAGSVDSKGTGATAV
ncbi:Transmembrane channel-like protein [Trichinella pseudospiralis]